MCMLLLGVCACVCMCVYDSCFYAASPPSHWNRAKASFPTTTTNTTIHCPTICEEGAETYRDKQQSLTIFPFQNKRLDQRLFLKL